LLFQANSNEPLPFLLYFAKRFFLLANESAFIEIVKIYYCYKGPVFNNLVLEGLNLSSTTASSNFL
jgi:hypothetical protein